MPVLSTSIVLDCFYLFSILRNLNLFWEILISLVSWLSLLGPVYKCSTSVFCFLKTYLPLLDTINPRDAGYYRVSELSIRKGDKWRKAPTSFSRSPSWEKRRELQSSKNLTENYDPPHLSWPSCALTTTKVVFIFQLLSCTRVHCAGPQVTRAYLREPVNLCVGNRRNPPGHWVFFLFSVEKILYQNNLKHIAFLLTFF